MRGLGSQALQLEKKTWLKKWKGGQEKDKTYFKKGYYDKVIFDGRQEEWDYSNWNYSSLVNKLPLLAHT